MAPQKDSCHRLLMGGGRTLNAPRTKPLEVPPNEGYLGLLWTIEADDGKTWVRLGSTWGTHDWDLSLPKTKFSCPSGIILRKRF